MTYAAYQPVDTVDETAGFTDMQGQASAMNMMAGRGTWSQSPTKALVVLWFVVLALYWFLGWFFRGQRK